MDLEQQVDWLSKSRRLGIQRHLPLLFMLFLACCYLTININQPWVSLYEENGLIFSSIAVNQWRFGLAATKGQGLADTTTIFASSIPGVPPSQEFQYLLTGPVQPQFYCDHPPLLGLTIAGAFGLLGYQFWVVRLVPILYSLASLIVFYFFVRRLFDLGVARFATFLCATFPMLAYYGRNVAHEAPTLFWTLILLSAYTHWKAAPQRRWLWVMGAAVVIGVCYDWPMCYFACIVFGVDWLASRRLSWALALATVAPAVITTFLMFAQIFWALGGTIQPVIDIFLVRTSTSTYLNVPITFSSWVGHLLLANIQGYGLWALPLMPWVAYFLVKRARAEGWSLRMRVLVMALLFGVSHILLFPNGAFYHDYWQFYLLPFYALSIGWAAVSLVRNRFPGMSLRTLVLVGAGLGIVLLNTPIIFGLYSSVSGVFVPLVHM